VAVRDHTVRGHTLRLHEVRHDSVLTIEATGEVDLENADRLSYCLDEAERSDAGRIVLDLRPLRFMDSTALRVVLVAARRMGGRLWVFRGTGDPAKVLTLTAIDQSLNLLD
jgi:anti-anti-sigma factor